MTKITNKNTLRLYEQVGFFLIIISSFVIKCRAIMSRAGLFSNCIVFVKLLGLITLAYVPQIMQCNRFVILYDCDVDTAKDKLGSKEVTN